jgi:ABC-type sugar transport system permease subunit
MTALAPQAAVRRRKINMLPYILSLPALIVCIGILVPFLTAIYYSMLRYRLNLPALKGFIWFNNYINFLTDPEFGTQSGSRASTPSSRLGSNSSSGFRSRCSFNGARASTMRFPSCSCSP